MPGIAKPVLVVDDRQDEKFTAALCDYFDVHIKHLATGDLLWTCPLGLVGVEDKVMTDLKASVRNDRLDDELRRLIAGFPIPILFVRGIEIGTRYAPEWGEPAIQKLLLRRQLHGAYIWRCQDADRWSAAKSLAVLHEYTQSLKSLEGVRREPRLAYHGPMGARAEYIYAILGGCPGIRNRRGTAVAIAATTPISSFMRWTATDFLAAGFSTRMATKLAAYVHAMEVTPGSI